MCICGSFNTISEAAQGLTVRFLNNEQTRADPGSALGSDPNVMGEKLKLVIVVYMSEAPVVML